MKYLVIATCLTIIGVAGYLKLTSQSMPAKYYAVEMETKVRPAYFEDMQFKNVDMRAPASVK